jgi:phage major head subunit gpT-like protein
MSIVAAPTQLLKGLQSLLIEALASAPKNPILETAATYVTSTSDQEDFAWIGEVSQVVEFVDEVQFDGLSDTSYELVNKKFTGGLQFKRDDLNDEKTGGMHQRIMDLANRAQRHAEKQLVDALTNGDDSTLGVCYDGGLFFTATHAARGKQTSTWTNLVSYSGSSTASAQDNIASSVALLLNMTDEANEPLNEYADEFYVIYPPALHKPISEAVNAGIVSNTSNVQFDGLKWKLIQCPRLTAHSAAEYYSAATRAAPRRSSTRTASL